MTGAIMICPMHKLYPTILGEFSFRYQFVSFVCTHLTKETTTCSFLKFFSLVLLCVFKFEIHNEEVIQSSGMDVS